MFLGAGENSLELCGWMIEPQGHGLESHQVAINTYIQVSINNKSDQCLLLSLLPCYGVEPAWLRYELEKGLRAVYCYEALKPAFLVELFLKFYFT